MKKKINWTFYLYYAGSWRLLYALPNPSARWSFSHLPLKQMLKKRCVFSRCRHLMLPWQAIFQVKWPKKRHLVMPCRCPPLDRRLLRCNETVCIYPVSSQNVTALEKVALFSCFLHVLSVYISAYVLSHVLVTSKWSGIVLQNWYSISSLEYELGSYCSNLTSAQVYLGQAYFLSRSCNISNRLYYWLPLQGSS